MIDQGCSIIICRKMCKLLVDEVYLKVIIHWYEEKCILLVYVVYVKVFLKYYEGKSVLFWLMKCMPKFHYNIMKEKMNPFNWWNVFLNCSKILWMQRCIPSIEEMYIKFSLKYYKGKCILLVDEVYLKVTLQYYEWKSVLF